MVTITDDKPEEKKPVDEVSDADDTIEPEDDVVTEKESKPTVIPYDKTADYPSMFEVVIQWPLAKTYTCVTP